MSWPNNIDRFYLGQRERLTPNEQAVIALAMADLQRNCNSLSVGFSVANVESLEASLIRFIMNSREDV